MNEEVQNLPLFSVVPDPNQPRKTFNETSLAELAASIAENGVILPIIVSPIGNDKYQIVAGERRWRASVIAKTPTIPAIVRDLGPLHRQLQALLENVQRSDLNPLEEANAYQQLQEEFSLSHEDIAQTVGKSRATITNSLRLLKLPDFVRTCIRDGNLTSGHAKVLLGFHNEADMIYLAGMIIDKQLSVREAEDAAIAMRKRHSTDQDETNSETTVTKSMQQLQLQKEYVENGLTRYFGTQVKLITDPSSAGSIQIKFHDAADLERICEIMGYTES